MPNSIRVALFGKNHLDLAYYYPEHNMLFTCNSQYRTEACKFLSWFSITLLIKTFGGRFFDVYLFHFLVLFFYHGITHKKPRVGSASQTATPLLLFLPPHHIRPCRQINCLFAFTFPESQFGVAFCKSEIDLMGRVSHEDWFLCS